MASTILKLSKEPLVRGDFSLSGSFIGGVRQKEEYSLGLDIGPRGIFRAFSEARKKI